MKFLNFLALLCMISFLFSCGGDDIDCSDPQSLSTQINQEIQQLNTVQAEYVAEPDNVAKCEAYLEALNDFIDFSEELLDCPDLNSAGLQDNLNISRMNLSNVNCN